GALEVPRRSADELVQVRLHRGAVHEVRPCGQRRAPVDRRAAGRAEVDAEGLPGVDRDVPGQLAGALAVEVAERVERGAVPAQAAVDRGRQAPGVHGDEVAAQRTHDVLTVGRLHLDDAGDADRRQAVQAEP